MPAKELSPNDLIVRTAAASKAVSRSLRENANYDGTPQGVPAGVVGTAKISSIRITQSDTPKETWNTLAVTGVVLSPREHVGRQVYPKFTYGLGQLEDDKPDQFGSAPVDRIVRGLIQFMQGLGITQRQIDAVKAEKPEKMIFAAFKTIEGSSGIEFNFKTSVQKKNPQYTDYKATGPVKIETTEVAPFDSTPTAGGDGAPVVGELWKYEDEVYTVTDVDSEAKTVCLENDTLIQTDLSWFGADGEQQITYVGTAA